MVSKRAVCYVADKNYMLPTLVSALGARRYVSAHNADIYVFAVDPEEAKIREINLFLKPYSIHIVPMDSRYFGDSDCANLKTSHVPLSTLGRFFMSDLLPASCKTITYIDGDTWINRDPSKLIEWDIPEGKLAAVDDLAITSGRYELMRNGRSVRDYLKKLGVSQKQGYFNAGVFHVTRATWKILEQEAFSFFKENVDLCAYRDQSAMNAVVGDRRINLSPVWNYQSCYCYCGLGGEVDPIICHFTGDSKPWMGAVEPWAGFFELYAKEIASLAFLELPYRKLLPKEVVVKNGEVEKYRFKMKYVFPFRNGLKRHLINRYIATSVLHDV